MTDSIRQLASSLRNDATNRQRVAGRLMTQLQNSPQGLPQLLDALGDPPQPDLILGMTGMPGSGKSTLTDVLIEWWRKHDPQSRIGVVSIDPSSTHGGAVLGDRVRMMRHATDEKVFIRSLATRGSMGGLTLGLQGILCVLRFLQCQYIVIETVGVGQSEVDIVEASDLTMLVHAPGQGDGIQLLKSGLMEIGDLIVVNKADREDASSLHGELLKTLQLKASASMHDEESEDEEAVGIHLVSAKEQTGIEDLVASINDFKVSRRESWIKKRVDSLNRELERLILDEANLTLASIMKNNPDLLDRVRKGELSVSEAASLLMNCNPAKTPDHESTANTLD